jgi:hypothetical protein
MEEESTAGDSGGADESTELEGDMDSGSRSAGKPVVLRDATGKVH